MVLEENRVCLVLLDSEDPQERGESQELMADPDQAVQQDLMVLQDLPDQLVEEASLDHKEREDPEGSQDSQALQEPLDPKDHKAPEESLDCQDP